MDDKEKKIAQEETPKDKKIHLTEDEAEKAAGGMKGSKTPKIVRPNDQYQR